MRVLGGISLTTQNVSDFEMAVRLLLLMLFEALVTGRRRFEALERRGVVLIRIKAHRGIVNLP